MMSLQFWPKSISRFCAGLLLRFQSPSQRCYHHLSTRLITNLGPQRSQVINRSFNNSAKLTQYMSHCMDSNSKLFWKLDLELLSLRFNRLKWKFSLNFSTATPFNRNRNITQKTLIFSHNNENFFKVLSIFGVIQMLLWGYLSIFSVQELRSGPVIKKENLPWWQKMLYTEGRYKNALSILCFTVGASIFFITFTYPRRAIKKLWLLKGGKDVEITSYSWLGQTYTFKAPVEHINCLQSRTASGSQIPLKLKNKHFYYLLDKNGSFHKPELFDFVIGLKRNLK